MNKSKVVLIRCSGYDDVEVYQTIKRGIGLLGGIGYFVKKDEEIVIKPNVLIGSDPESV